MTFSDILRTRAVEHPDRTALISAGTPFTYEQIDDATTRLARALVEQGVRPGDRVAIHWHNSFEAARIYFAIFRAGAIAVPINLRLKPSEIAYIFQHSGALMCFSAPALSPLAMEAAASCPGVKLVTSAIPDSTADTKLPCVSEDDIFLLMYTSGTTARPKGVCMTQRALMVNCQWMDAEVTGPGDIGLCVTPMMHIAALFMVIAAIYSKIPIVLLPAFDPAAILDSIERHGCTYTFTLPAFLNFILDEQARRPRNVSSIHSMLVGGDSVPIAMQTRYRETFGGRPLRECYGLTEAGILAVNPLNAVREGSMGLPSAAEIRIADAEGDELPRGETGEIVVRYAGAARAYWNDEQASAELMRGGWLHTGDLGIQDESGYLWFRGRVKQIIVRAGSNISPQEVEEALYLHSEVREAGVVGKLDPVYGEVVVAFVALRQRELPDGKAELREFVRQRLADYKVPEEIIFMPELPKGLTGKVDRRALKEMLANKSSMNAVA